MIYSISAVLAAVLMPAGKPPAPQLIGFGLVFNILGNGSDSLFTQQVATDVLGRFPGASSEVAAGLAAALSRAGFVSTVLVIASAPQSVAPGDRGHVTVEAIDDSRSVRGGFLLPTPLKGPDGQPSATASGFLPLFSRKPVSVTLEAGLTRQPPRRR